MLRRTKWYKKFWEVFKMRLNKKGSSVLCFILIMGLMLSSFTFADTTDTTNQDDRQIYSDVAETDWFYNAVQTMSKYGIINGYGDGTFKPMNVVNRDEFAKMMVSALKLELGEDDSSFADVEDTYWATPYIETAKKYLTGYKQSTGEVYFKPKENAVREDMAVALVRALDFAPVKDSDVLNVFKDKEKISDQLKPYVAAAYQKELMNGSQETDGLYFNPIKSLTRAEAAKLLLTVIEDQKIVFDEVKVIFHDEDDEDDEDKDDEDKDDEDDEERGTAPKVKVELAGKKFKIKWDKVNKDGLKGYKVVASKNNENPKYPDDGYMYWFEGHNTHVAFFDINTNYKNGDFGGKFKAGEEYYISVTAYYEDKKVPGNAVKVKMPGTASEEVKDFVTPKVEGSVTGDDVILEWNAIDHPNFEGYKIVASKGNSAPKYPEDGYKVYITNKEQTRYEINAGDGYNNGDFGGKFVAGEEYYFSITAVYSDRKIAGNSVKIQMPAVEAPESYIAPKVEGLVSGGDVIIKWDKIAHPKFQGYKVVASKNNPNPVYSADGYKVYLRDKSTTAYSIGAWDLYNNGDFSGKFKPGEEYYFSITAIYTDKKVAGNAVRLKIPLNN